MLSKPKVLRVSVTNTLRGGKTSELPLLSSTPTLTSNSKHLPSLPTSTTSKNTEQEHSPANYNIHQPLPVTRQLRQEGVVGSTTTATIGDQTTARGYTAAAGMPSTKPYVIVTGFGPFGSHKVNASSVAVWKLKEKGLNNDSVELCVMEMAVEYDAVKEMVPRLWETYNPLLVVHVGVSGIATELTLEQLAHNDGYDKIDVQGKCPQTQCCVDGRDKHCVLVSGINMKRVCTKVNSSSTGVKARVSHDPGRYLCEFSYFSSLHISHDNAAFIHVPPLDSPYSADQLVEALRVAINEMIQQVTCP